MQLWVRIHVVEELLVVLKLLVPLRSLRVSEVVSQWGQNHLGTEQLGFLSILIQQHESPLEGKRDEEGGREKCTSLVNKNG